MGVAEFLHRRIRAHKEDSADEDGSASQPTSPVSNDDAASVESAVQDGEESTESDSAPEGV